VLAGVKAVSSTQRLSLRGAAWACAVTAARHFEELESASARKSRCSVAKRAHGAPPHTYTYVHIHTYIRTHTNLIDVHPCTFVQPNQCSYILTIISVHRQHSTIHIGLLVYKYIRIQYLYYLTRLHTTLSQFLIFSE